MNLISNTKNKKIKNKEKIINDKAKKVLIEYPKKHFLQLILPFTNEIMLLFTETGLLPRWIYNPTSTIYWQIIIRYLINCIALIGMTWNISYIATKSDSQLTGVIISIGFISITYFIPQLLFKKIINTTNNNKVIFILGSITLIILIILESIWSYCGLKFARKYKNPYIRKQVTINIIILLCFIIFIFIFLLFIFHSFFEFKNYI